MKFGLAPTTRKMCIGSLTPARDRNMLDRSQKEVEAQASVAALSRFGGNISFPGEDLPIRLPKSS
jgi:hypothetical protein